MSNPLSIIRSQQTEEAYTDISILRRELEKTHKERDQAPLDGNQPSHEKDKTALDRDQAVLERDKVILERHLLIAELKQTRRVHKSTANSDQLKSELERLQTRQGE